MTLTASLLIGMSLGTMALARDGNATDGQRTISTTGEALIKVIPDQVILTLGIETIEKDLAKARSANDERVRKVLAVARSSGLGDKDIATDQVSIAPRYDSSYENVQTRPVAYEVQKSVVLTLRDLSKFEALLAACLDAGANYVHGVQFATGELRKHRDAARSLAIKAAVEKAQALAGELSRKVGAPRTISDDGGGWWSSYGSYWGGERYSQMSQNVMQAPSGPLAPEGETMAPGTIGVSASVSVTFDLE